MAQIHSFYITNAQSELKFSSNNLNDNELEIALQEITSAMINNDDLFDEEEDYVFSDNDGINLDGVNTNDLIITELIDLDIPEFGDVEDSRDSRDFEDSGEDSVASDGIDSQSEDSNIDFEAILAEEFD